MRTDQDWKVAVKVTQGKYRDTFGPYFLTGSNHSVREQAVQRVCAAEYEGRLTPERLQEIARVQTQTVVYRD